MAALPVAVLGAALTVAGCSGGSPGPAAAPPVAGTSIIAAGTGAIAAPPAGGLTATLLTGPGATPGTAVTLGSSLTPPANAILPSSVRRSAALANAVPFFYVTLTVSQLLPAPVFTAQTLTLNGQPADATYFEEFDDTTSAPGSRLLTFQGTAAGNVVTFTTPFAAGAAFLAGHTYTLMYYYTPGLPTPAPSSAPSPSAAPSGAPTPAPTQTPVPTPGPSSSATLVAAGTVASIAIPTVGGITGTAQFGGFNVASTVTLSSVAGLPAGVPAPTAGGTVFFAEGISATPAVTISSLNCPGGCAATIPLTLNPTLNLIAAANGKTFYVAECSTTACPVVAADSVALPLSGASLVVVSQTFPDLTAFGPSPVWLVFSYR